MSMKQLCINPEINMDDVMLAMIEDFGVDDLVAFVEELIERVADDEFSHELYELMRKKHADWLEQSGVSECEYQTDFSPTVYEGIEASVAEDEIDDEDEHWTIDPDEIDDELEEDVDIDDVFTTDEDDK